MRPLVRGAFVLALSCVLGGSATAAARPDRTAVLGFEPSGGVAPLALWSGEPRGPEGTVFLDSTVVHGGRYSGRLERKPDSPASFSSFAYSLPVDFTGQRIQLKGWIKYEGVEGSVGLWMREDGRAGAEQFDNMAARKLQGTADWQEVSIDLPLSSSARTIIVGALLRGVGRLWADDLRIEVDGRPLAEAPAWAAPRTVLDTDTAFVAGSGIADVPLSELQLDHLVLLGRVWGFLKYHHPAIVRGQRHWDFDLFRVLPAVLAADTHAEAQQAIVRWVDGLGEVPPCTRCAKAPQKAELLPRLAWLDDRALLGSELASRLKRVYESRPDTSSQFFVSLFPGVLNPDFDSERDYAGTALPDLGYRWLAVFRFWNIVEYWSPNRDLTGEDWPAVLRQALRGMTHVTTSEGYSRELIALVAKLHDSHTNLWSHLRARPPGGRALPAVSVRFLGTRAVVAGFTNPRLGPATGLAVGDVIEAVAGVPVDSLVARWRPWYAASNDAAQRRDMARELLLGDPGPVELRIRRGARVSLVRSVRVPVDSLDRRAESVHDRPGPTFRRVSEDVAYLKLSSVKISDVPTYVEGAKGAKALVIDIRNYPSEFVVFALGGHLVDRPLPFARFSNGDPANPGAFTMGTPLTLSPVEPSITAKVAILVDESTQSQAEYTTMAFRARPGTLVLGSQTAGADGNVSRFTLPGGRSTMISGIGVFYPDGKPTQRIGIVPDIKVIPTPEGLRAGRDEVLERAVRELLGRPMSSAERAAFSPPEP